MCRAQVRRGGGFFLLFIEAVSARAKSEETMRGAVRRIEGLIKFYIDKGGRTPGRTHG